jgi:predicted nucleic acid-binding protein
VRQVYVDSCIVIYLLEAPPEIREAVRDALRPWEGQPAQVYVSALTRLECRVRPLRENSLELLAAYDRFFGSRDLRRCRLTSAVYDLATDLRAEHGIKTPDALHLAAALDSGCSEFWTNDLRLPTTLGERIRIRVLPG